MVKQLLYKKGLSTIITTMILIGMSIVAIGLVWAFVSGLIKGQIKNSESCYNSYDKVKLNPDYTCYEHVGTNYYLRFSISVGDVAPEKIVIGVASTSEVKTYEITNQTLSVEGLAMYPSNITSIFLPPKNGGLTYRTTAFTGKFDSVKIAPVFKGTQCDVSDTINEFVDCALII